MAHKHYDDTGRDLGHAYIPRGDNANYPMVANTNPQVAFMQGNPPQYPIYQSFPMGPNAVPIDFPQPYAVQVMVPIPIQMNREQAPPLPGESNKSDFDEMKPTNSGMQGDLDYFMNRSDRKERRYRSRSSSKSAGELSDSTDRNYRSRSHSKEKLSDISSRKGGTKASAGDKRPENPFRKRKSSSQSPERLAANPFRKKRERSRSIEKNLENPFRKRKTDSIDKMSINLMKRLKGRDESPLPKSYRRSRSSSRKRESDSWRKKNRQSGSQRDELRERYSGKRDRERYSEKEGNYRDRSSDNQDKFTKTGNRYSEKSEMYSEGRERFRETRDNYGEYSRHRSKSPYFNENLRDASQSFSRDNIHYERHEKRDWSPAMSPEKRNYVYGGRNYRSKGDYHEELEEIRSHSEHSFHFDMQDEQIDRRRKASRQSYSPLSDDSNDDRGGIGLKIHVSQRGRWIENESKQLPGPSRKTKLMVDGIVIESRNESIGRKSNCEVSLRSSATKFLEDGVEVYFDEHLPSRRRSSDASLGVEDVSDVESYDSQRESKMLDRVSPRYTEDHRSFNKDSSVWSERASYREDISADRSDTGRHGSEKLSVQNICIDYNIDKQGCRNKFCRYLHLCKFFILGLCKFGDNCKRCHDVLGPQPLALLRKQNPTIQRTKYFNDKIGEILFSRFKRNRSGDNVGIPENIIDKGRRSPSVESIKSEESVPESIDSFDARYYRDGAVPKKNKDKKELKEEKTKLEEVNSDYKVIDELDEDDDNATDENVDKTDSAKQTEIKEVAEESLESKMDKNISESDAQDDTKENNSVKEKQVKQQTKSVKKDVIVKSSGNNQSSNDKDKNAKKPESKREDKDQVSKEIAQIDSDNKDNAKKKTCDNKGKVDKKISDNKNAPNQKISVNKLTLNKKTSDNKNTANKKISDNKDKANMKTSDNKNTANKKISDNKDKANMKTSDNQNNAKKKIGQVKIDTKTDVKSEKQESDRKVERDESGSLSPVSVDNIEDWDKLDKYERISEDGLSDEEKMVEVIIDEDLESVSSNESTDEHEKEIDISPHKVAVPIGMNDPLVFNKSNSASDSKSETAGPQSGLTTEPTFVSNIQPTAFPPPVNLSVPPPVNLNVPPPVNLNVLPPVNINVPPPVNFNVPPPMLPTVYPVMHQPPATTRPLFQAVNSPGLPNVNVSNPTFQHGFKPQGLMDPNLGPMVRSPRPSMVSHPGQMVPGQSPSMVPHPGQILPVSRPSMVPHPGQMVPGSSHSMVPHPNQMVSNIIQQPLSVPNVNHLPSPNVIKEVIDSLAKKQEVKHKETEAKKASEAAAESKKKEVKRIDPDLNEPMKKLWQFPHKSVINLSIIEFVTETEAYKDELVAEMVKLLVTINLPYVTLKKLMSVIKEKIQINIRTPIDLRKILELHSDNFQIVETVDSDDDSDDGEVRKNVQIKAKLKLGFCSKHGYLPFYVGKCDCKQLHLCKFHFLSHCPNKNCKFGHKLKTDHNINTLKHHRLHRMTGEEIMEFLRDIDSRNIETVPGVCKFYNSNMSKESGCYKGNVTDYQDICHNLHLCFYYVKGKCFVQDCQRSHSIRDTQPLSLLKKYGLDPDEFGEEKIRNLIELKTVDVKKRKEEKAEHFQAVRHSRPEGAQNLQVFPNKSEGSVSNSESQQAVSAANTTIKIKKSKKPSVKLPSVCKFFNNPSGCKKKDWGAAGFCLFLHVCQKYVNGQCKIGEKCKRPHTFFSGEPAALITRYGIDLSRLTEQEILDTLKENKNALAELPMIGDDEEEEEEQVAGQNQTVNKGGNNAASAQAPANAQLSYGGSRGASSEFSSHNIDEVLQHIMKERGNAR